MAAPAIAVFEYDNGWDFTRWSGAAAIVLAAHVGLAGTYMLLRAAQPQGAVMTPAVIIDLSPMPVAPASPLDVAPGPEMVEAQQPPEPQRLEPPPPEPQVIEPLPPPPVVEPLVVATPEPPPPPPQATLESKPEPSPPEPKRVERKPPAPHTTAAPRSERQTADTPAAPSPGSVSNSASIASWRDLIVSKLQSAKRYPSSAEQRRATGVVTLSFTLSRSGNVLSRSIGRSSGHPDLDQEVLAMVQRAQPFPAFPAGMPQASVHLSVPIRFTLR